NKVDLVLVNKLFKKSTEHEYNQGYLAGCASQNHYGGWDSHCLLAEIRKVGLPLLFSLVTEAAKLIIPEGNESSSKSERPSKKVI
ncbi:hypothetical protein C1H46_039444, partial [Malus baccata]